MDIKRTNGYALAPNGLVPWLAFTLLASLGLVLVLFANQPPQIVSWQLWARYTATFSYFLFLASYTASPLYELMQNKATTWLRRHRRNTGASFAVAHIIHLAALTSYLIIADSPTDSSTLIFGGFGYLLMFAMLATSNDALIRRMGLVNWRRLHKFGAHYLAFIFAVTYLGTLEADPPRPLLLVGLIWIAILLRLLATLKSIIKRNTA